MHTESSQCNIGTQTDGRCHLKRVFLVVVVRNHFFVNTWITYNRARVFVCGHSRWNISVGSTVNWPSLFAESMFALCPFCLRVRFDCVRVCVCVCTVINHWLCLVQPLHHLSQTCSFSCHYSIISSIYPLSNYFWNDDCNIVSINRINCTIIQLSSFSMYSFVANFWAFSRPRTGFIQTGSVNLILNIFIKQILCFQKVTKNIDVSSVLKQVSWCKLIQSHGQRLNTANTTTLPIRSGTKWIRVQFAGTNIENKGNIEIQDSHNINAIDRTLINWLSNTNN